MIKEITETIAAILTIINLLLFIAGSSKDERLNPSTRQGIANSIIFLRVNFFSLAGLVVGICGIVIEYSFTDKVTKHFVLAVAFFSIFASFHLASMLLYAFMRRYSDRIVDALHREKQ